MKLTATLSLAIALSATLAWSQSLGQLADKEKERRKKNKEAGKVVKVVTESELQAGQSTAPPEEGTEATTSSPSSYPPRPSGSELGSGGSSIPAGASLQDKLTAFDSIKRKYEKDVADINAEIEKNRARLQQIEQDLIAQNAAGLPTAPQANMRVQNPAMIPALQQEKNDLQAKNQQLEAKKDSLWKDVEARARRAGIPPGYIRR